MCSSVAQSAHTQTLKSSTWDGREVVSMDHGNHLSRAKDSATSHLLQLHLHLPLHSLMLGDEI
jgi:hypothetical protein